MGESIVSDRSGRELLLRVAETSEDVLDAWGLVYNSYLSNGLIPPNPHGIHTSASAIHPGNVVAMAFYDSNPVSTLTGIVDAPDNPIPVSKVFPDIFNRLRGDGSKLYEAGLFGNGNSPAENSFTSLMEIFRTVYAYGRDCINATDIVFGVHPRQRDFYESVLGFECISNERTYSRLNSAPVVLMRGNYGEISSRSYKPKGLRILEERRDSDKELFSNRFPFPDKEVSGVPFSDFIAA